MWVGQYRYADPRYDELFLGNHIRLLPRAVCGGAVLEEDEPLRRMAGMWSGFLIALVPAVSKLLSLVGVSAPIVAKLAGLGPVFAVAAMIVSLLTLLCCQRH